MKCSKFFYYNTVEFVIVNGHKLLINSLCRKTDFVFLEENEAFHQCKFFKKDGVEFCSFPVTNCNFFLLVLLLQKKGWERLFIT